MSQYWGAGRLGSTQSVAYTGTAGTIGTVLGGGTQKVRVVMTTAGYVKIGKAASATAADAYVAADSPEYFTANSGEVVSAIQLSSGGTLYVTEVS